MTPEHSAFLDRLMARRRFGMKPGLETMRTVMAALGNPQDALRVIHVAGTNGKGATCALLETALHAAGYHTARYTSPHLVRLAERFFIDCAPVPEARLEEVASRVFPVVERLEAETGREVTFFECLTAVAFVLFAEEKVDVVVLETGLGGRLDATNIVRGTLVSVITRIGLDHCEWLGTTHAAIAEEKAGIIKPGRPVVCGVMPQAARDTIARFASLNGSEFRSVDECVSVRSLDPLTLTTPHRALPPIAYALFGAFQVENARTALAVLDLLDEEHVFNVPDHAVVAGFQSVVWPGRCQRIDWAGVPVVVDGAHNPDGARALRDSLRLANVREPVGLVAGFCGDKDVLAHLRIMSGVTTHGWAVPIRNARSLDPHETAERMLMAGFSAAEACEGLPDALAQAFTWAKATGGSLVVCGSLFLAGEALVELGAFPWAATSPEPNERSLH